MENDFEVFYAPATETEKPRLIDSVRRNESGEAIGFYSNQSQQSLEAEYKRKLAIEKWSVVSDLIEESHCTEPSSITLEQWDDALDTLPPQDWNKANGVESFKFMEHYWGDVTSIYARTASNQCFVFRGRASMTAKDVADKIKKFIADCENTVCISSIYYS